MKRKVKVDQNRLLGFRVQPKTEGSGAEQISAKLGAKIGVPPKA